MVMDRISHSGALEKEILEADDVGCVHSKSLTIKLGNKSALFSKIDIKNSNESSSLYNSPSLYSPASSAFVSALQSPYISPRLPELIPHTSSEHTTPVTQSSSSFSPPLSFYGSLSDDIPSTSYTPTPELEPESSDYSECPTDDQKPRYINEPTAPTAAPRISFSFPVPRISFAKASVSPNNAILRSCDVFIGYHGQNTNLARFCKWFKSELELQGIACFVADRSKYSDNQSHEIADRIICSATFGVVVVSTSSLLNPLSIEEILFFSQKKNLVPILFDTDVTEVSNVSSDCNDKEWKEAFEGLIKAHENKLEANEGNWRSCVSKAAVILKGKLRRKSVAKAEIDTLIGSEEFILPRNKAFVGREKELMEIEISFFGCGECLEPEYHPKLQPGVKRGEASSDGISSEGFADEESDTVRMTGGRYISLELKKSKEPTLEAWIEPMIGKSPSKRSSKYKKSRMVNNKSMTHLSSVICINGVSGIGKTEVALEFAYRYAQRYKMVLWVGGEARYFRQNILNLSMNLGLDVSAEAEKERGRIRNFEEQEYDAFQRVKRELFREMPYLVIIDNLETEKEWWEGKDLHDLIPRNTGASHVIITTRLPKVMNFEPLHLSQLQITDAMILIKGKRGKEYPHEEVAYLKRLEERLERSTFGLSLVALLLAELSVAPSALFEAVNHVLLPDEDISRSPCLSILSAPDEQFWKNNIFLMKILKFCFAVLEKISEERNLLASRMLLSGAWLSPAPVPVVLLASASKRIPFSKNKFKEWTKSIKLTMFCCHSSRNNVIESSVNLLIKLGLARRTKVQVRTTGQCWIQFHPIVQLFAKC